MDSDKRNDEPDVAMALVIDRSGSMTGLPLEMAKQAAKATADTLGPDDLLEVIAFDSQPTRIVQMTAAKHGARIQADIARIQAGGGTEIFPALDAAYQALSAARAKAKAHRSLDRRPGADDRHPGFGPSHGFRGNHRHHGRTRHRR